MPFRFHCEECDVRIKVPDGSEGKKVRCPGCGHVQRVPVGAGMPAATAVVTPARREPNVPERVHETVKRPAKKGREERQEREERDEREMPQERLEPQEQATSAVRPEAVQPVAAPQIAPQDESEEDDSPKVEATDHHEALLSLLAQDRGTRKPSEDADSDDSSADAAFQSIISEMPAGEPEQGEDASPMKPPAATANVDTPKVVSHTPSDAGGDHDTSGDISQPTNDESTAAGQPTVIHASAAVTSPESADENPASDEDEKAHSPHLAETSEPANGADESLDEEAESPAGEVRDLFDDFVEREEKERQSLAAAGEALPPSEVRATDKPVTTSISASSGVEDASADEDAGPAAPEPVVVVKTPPRIGRPAPVGAAADRSMEKKPVPQGISLAPAQVKSTAPVEEEPVDAIGADDEPEPATDAAAQLAAAAAVISTASARAAAEPVIPQRASLPTPLADAPVARPRRMTPPPGLVTLLVLCWVLRVLACVSLASLVKLALIWTDTGAKLFDVLIVAPLGLGVVIGLWTLGELAKVTRDHVRSNHR